MKKRIVSALALTAITLTLVAIPAAAQEGVTNDPGAGAAITDTNLQPGEFTVTGVMEYRDADGGKYVVGDWVLMGDTERFAAHVGKQVVLYGLMWDGMAGTEPTFMVRDLSQVKDLPGEAAPAGQPLREVDARPANFKQLTLDGKFVKLDQGAEIIDGVLMLPLRAVVEGLGGRVQWDDAARAVTVEMPDRMAYFWIGQEQAEMNQNNVRYLTRNLIAMAKAPVLINSRTLISADAVTQVLGLYASPTVDGTLNIVPAQ